jgi:GNAT superfamily N-acetyltransferase
MTDHEVDHLARSLKPIMDPDIVFIAETADGTPAGLALNMPDIHQALRLSGGGRYWPLGLPRFMWHRRHIDQVRLMLVGVLPGYRGRGIDGACLLETARTTLQKGYKRLEGSWILEDNDDMNLIIERVGGRHYKTYRVYQKDL